MHLPDDLTQAVNQTVTRHLSTQFGSRDLLLTADEFREVSTEAAEMGARLLEPMIHQCYPLSQYDTQVINVAFDDHDEASRVCAALAFGASTAMLFGRPGEEVQIGLSDLVVEVAALRAVEHDRPAAAVAADLGFELFEDAHAVSFSPTRPPSPA